MTFPDNCKYTKDHEWIRLESGNTAYVGITDFAQGELGELVYVEVDSKLIGKTVDAHQVFGTVEAVKTTSDLYMPIKSTILEVNAALDANPNFINEDPYGTGWIVKVEIADLTSLEGEGVLDAAAYQDLVG